MNCKIRIPGGTVLIGDDEVDFSTVRGPCLVITNNLFSREQAHRLVRAPHLARLYLGELTSVDFVSLLAVKKYIRVPQITVVYAEQVLWFVRAITATSCLFATTVSIQHPDLRMFDILEEQKRVRVYLRSGHDDFTKFFITNDPAIGQSDWDEFVLFNTPDTLVLMVPHGDDDVDASAYMGENYEQVIIPFATEYFGLYVPPCRELVCDWLIGQFPIGALQVQYESLRIHVSRARDLGAFRVEDLHPLTGRVVITGCSAEITEDLRRRTNTRSVLALLSSTVPRVSANSAIRRLGPVLIRCVAETLL